MSKIERPVIPTKLTEDNKLEPAIEVNDVVNHPNHYNKGTIECRKIIDEMVIGYGEKRSVDVANITKYIYRSPYKNGLQDLEKARWYLNNLIDEMRKVEL